MEKKKKKNQKKDFNKIKARFAEGKCKINSLKIRLQKCENFKGKLNNMEQVKMDY